MDTTMAQPSLQEVFRIIHDAVAKGAWWPLAGLALVFLVSALRKLAAAKMGKVGMWLATDHGAMLLTALGAALSGVSVSLLAGMAPTKSTLVGAAMAGGGALVAYPTVQKFLQSWFGINIGLAGSFKATSVVTAPNGKQSVTTEPPSLSVAQAPPRSSEGGFMSTRLLWIIIALSFFGVVAAAFAGCACNPKTKKIDSATCAYQVLTAVDVVNGALMHGLAQYDRGCAAETRALTQAGRADEAVLKGEGCKRASDTGKKVVYGVADGVGVAADGVEIGVKAGQKDFTGLVAPVVQAAKDAVKLLQDQAVKVPAAVTAVLGGL